MSSLTIAFLVGANLALLYALMGMPLGRRTISASARVAASRERLWQVLWPLGREAGWSGEIVAAAPVAGKRDLVEVTYSREGRDGEPVRRVVELEEVVEHERFGRRVVDDTMLDPSFWADYRDEVRLADEEAVTRVTLVSTDRYHGAAFLAVRYFAMRRELAKLRRWAETGRYRAGGVFEHPATQFGFATLSALILWPLFGVTVGGFVAAALLTLVVALHELGHLAAFRVMGHRRVRMIFVPLLGGIAIGGRPYDTRFEVAFVALMGAGFSAFLVPVAIAASTAAERVGDHRAAMLLATLAGLAALFNLANLVPVWKFDGGQVLRQVFSGAAALSAASFVILTAFLWLGWMAGFSPEVLIVAGVVFSILSIITAGSGVKLRHELKPISTRERVAVAAALVAVFAIHGLGVLWAAAKFV